MPACSAEVAVDSHRSMFPGTDILGLINGQAASGVGQVVLTDRRSLRTWHPVPLHNTSDSTCVIPIVQLKAAISDRSLPSEA